MTRALSAAERSFPTSEVRGRSPEDPMPKGRWPRGVTLCPSSGAVVESARLRRRRNSQEEIPCIRGQGRKPGGRSRGVTPRPRSGAAAESARLQRCRNGREELPKSEARGGSREDQPHARGQGQRPGGPTPHPRSPGCVSAGGPRGAIPR